MTKKIGLLFLVLVTLLATNSYARETDAHKFWHGDGGKIVGAGLLYWVVSSNLDDDDESLNLNAKKNSFRKNDLLNYLANVDDYSLFLNVPLTNAGAFDTYAFIGTNIEMLSLSDDRSYFDNGSVAGVGFRFNLENESRMMLEYSTTTSEQQFESSSYTLSYNYTF